MDNNTYLYSVLNKYTPIDRSGYIYSVFYPLISSWAKDYLLEMKLSGSTAKGTAVLGINDVDYLISLHNSVLNSMSLEEIFDSLYSKLIGAGICTNVRKQRVSIGFNHYGVDVDFTPAVKDSGNTNFHKLYLNEKNKRWVLTNIHKHIEYVKQSERTNEIKLLKIWRKLHNLDFPTVYLESVVIENLKGHNYHDLSNNFVRIMEYLSKSFIYDVYYDISNSNNKLSDSLTNTEKTRIVVRAKISLNSSWQNVIW